MSSPELAHSRAPIVDSLIEESFPDAVFGSASARKRKNSNPKPVPRVDTSAHARKNSIPMPGAGAPPKPQRNPARRHSRSPSGVTVNRPDSPDLQAILASTPRPRKKASTALSPTSVRSRSNLTLAGPSRKSSKADGSPDNIPRVLDYGAIAEGESDDMGLDKAMEGDGSESDSSIDLHTPLPHLMFRDGLLSPRSKLFPQGSPSLDGSPFTDDKNDDPMLSRARSVMSVASTTGSLQTKSGYLRDPRDSARRRVRHRDQQLLRMGMGLTTGLGWSDSEDEDAPSALTRKLIQTHSARKPSLSASSSFSRPSSHLTRDSTSRLSLCSPPPMTPPLPPGSLRQNTLTRSASTSFSWVRPAPTDTSNKVPRSEPRNRTESSASVSTVSTMSQYSQASSATSKSGSPTPVARRPMPRSGEVKAEIKGDKPQTETGDEDKLRPPLPPRKRSESSTSTSSFRTASSGSLGSSGTSTAPTTSATTPNVPTKAVPNIPRPLKLPQSTSLSSIRSRLSRSTSTSGTVYATTSVIPSSSGHQRSRTVSAFQPALLLPRSVKASAQRPVPISIVKSLGSGSTAPITPHWPTTPSASTSTPVSPTASPPSSPRMRPLVSGPRPKPRTGTGMTYRSSSAYSSLQDAAMRMRTMSLAGSHSGDMGS